MEHKEYIRHIPGSKYAVLMIHGIAGTPAHFRDLIPLVPEDWSVYNILLDGHGKQVEDFARASMAAWKRQVAELVASLLDRHEKLMIVGHSMGTLFAIQAANRHPNRICHLFLMNPPLAVCVKGSAMLGSVRVALGRAKPGSSAHTMAQATSIRMTAKLWKYLSWAPRFVELLHEIRLTRQEIPRLQVPCHCFLSKHDELVSLQSSRYLKNPHFQVTLLPHSSHYGYTPEDTHTLQEAFLSILESM